MGQDVDHLRQCSTVVGVSTPGQSVCGPTIRQTFSGTGQRTFKSSHISPPRDGLSLSDGWWERSELDETQGHGEGPVRTF